MDGTEAQLSVSGQLCALLLLLWYLELRCRQEGVWLSWFIWPPVHL